MARSSKKSDATLSVAKQLAFQPILVAARKAKLASAVSAAAAGCAQQALRADVSRLGDARVLKLAAAAGVRDELVVATPCLLKQKPTTLGFYRLLVGISKKQFYHGSSGFGLLEAMEEGGAITARQEAALEPACVELNRLIAELIIPLEPNFTPDDVRELPLLTLGAQLDGAYRVAIGESAAQAIFALMGELLRKHVTNTTATKIELTDATGMSVTIKRASDPDILIARDDGSARPRKIALEIKGGKDLSNAHNRAGEAEKSHLKAKAKNATDFWTIASMPKNNLTEFKNQSPTTRVWFDLSEVVARKGPSWEEFRRQISSAVGVKLKS